MWSLFQILARMPLPLMQGLGAGLGWLVWALSPAYRREFRKQVQAAGVPWAKARPAIAHLGRMTAELPWLWARPAGQSVLSRVTFDGLDRYDAAMNKGRGVIILSPHLGCWEIGAQALAEVRLNPHGPLAVLFRPSRKATLAGIQLQARERDGVVPAAADARDGQGEWAPWFGRPVYTMTLLVKLAEQTGAEVLWCWAERLNGGRFKVHLAQQSLAVDLSDAQQPMHDRLAQMNQGIEALVLQAPGQYLWPYARDKQPRAGGAS